MTQPHEHYYVPAQSKWPIIATLGMGTSVYGLATWFNDMSAQRADSNGPLIFSIGGLFLALFRLNFTLGKTEIIHQRNMAGADVVAATTFDTVEEFVVFQLVELAGA